MKKILSTAYTDAMFNLGIFLLRIPLGVLMCLDHGILKIAHFSQWEGSFFNFMQLGSKTSLVLSIFAEVFASAFIFLGLFTRIAAIILLIDMGVAIFLFNSGQPLAKFEDAILYFVGYLLILMVGPGKISIDAFTGK